VYEPLVSNINSLFYSLGFHLFIGNLVYMHTLGRRERALELASRFQEAVHGDDLTFRQITAAHAPAGKDPIEQIISFCVYNRDAILKELDEVKRMGGWVVELTSTSLWSLLTYWGERHESLRVFCDQSVPLRDQLSFINMMVGRTDKHTLRLGTRERSIMFNLSEPVSLVSSVDAPGVQLADVLAATVCAAMETPKDEWHRSALGRCFELDTIGDDCIYPDLDHVDLRKKHAVINCMLMLELLERSRDSRSLTEGIGEFIEATFASYPEYERQQHYDLDISPELTPFGNGGPRALEYPSRGNSVCSEIRAKADLFRRHEALQLVEPVDHNTQFIVHGARLGLFQQQESLAIR